MGVIHREEAEKEIKAWLDYKKVSETRRKAVEDNIDALITAVEDGNLIIDPSTFVLTQKLNFPLDTPELTYKPRLTVEEVRNRLTTVKVDDGHGRIIAYMAALTGKNSGIFNKMDSEDFALAGNIAVFFMR